jgi:hypothetical protein
MPKMTPQSTQPEDREILEEITQEVIAQEKEAKINKTGARDLFNKHKLSLETVAQNMKSLLSMGEESTKLKILQDLLKIHGALEGEVESKSISISFNFSNSQDQLGKVQVLIPRSQ